MPTLLFRNIAGRCGRAGEFAEGDTIIVDSPDEGYTSYRSRHQEYVRLYVNPPPYPLRSSVERAMEPGSEESLPSMVAVLESQIAAHIDACEKSEDIERKFTQSLYVGQQYTAAEYIHGQMIQFTTDMIAEPNYPVMQRQSPLQLTDFGKVVLRTGLSPRSGIALANFIQSFVSPQEPRSTIRKTYGVIWEPLVAAMWNRVREVSDIQELSPKRQRIGKRGYPVRFDNFPLVAMAWVSGVPIELIAFLTFRGESIERRQIRSWLNEEKQVPDPDFEEDIEQVAAFCNEYLAGQWAWVFRGASTIAGSLNSPEIASQTTVLASRLEYGVKYIATAELLQQGCPIDRAKLDWLIGSFRVPPLTQSKAIDTKQFLEWIITGEKQLVGSSFTPFARIRITVEDIEELKRFLQAEIQ